VEGEGKGERGIKGENDIKADQTERLPMTMSVSISTQINENSEEHDEV
jgi:hypothetical protein